MAKGSYCHAKGSDLFAGGVEAPIRTTGPYSTVQYKFNDAAQLPLTNKQSALTAATHSLQARKALKPDLALTACRKRLPYSMKALDLKAQAVTAAAEHS